MRAIFLNQIWIEIRPPKWWILPQAFDWVGVFENYVYLQEGIGYTSTAWASEKQTPFLLQWIYLSELVSKKKDDELNILFKIIYVLILR